MTEREFIKEVHPISEGLYRIAFYILEDRAEAEDAVQEVLLKLWERRELLSGIKNLKAYCNTLIRNYCIDIIRKGHRLSAIDETIADAEESDTKTTARQQLSETLLAIEKLGPRQKEALRLLSLEDYSYNQISREMGISPLNARVLVSQARKKLKKMTRTNSQKK